jgi:hypothetical protein
MAPDATNEHPHPMQTHLDAFDAQHPDQMTAHLRGEHGWTIWPDEEDDLCTLKAMHRVAHQHDTDEPRLTDCPPLTPPCCWCGQPEPMIDSDEDTNIYLVQQFPDGYYHAPCFDSYVIERINAEVRKNR